MILVSIVGLIITPVAYLGLVLGMLHFTTKAHGPVPGCAASTRMCMEHVWPLYWRRIANCLLQG